MKTSEVIKNLQHMIDIYGDLDFSISMKIPPKNIKSIIYSDVLFFNYCQSDDIDEIFIQDYPF